MHGPDPLFAMADSLMKATSADGLEVSFRAHDRGYTRFANSYIHQNMVESNLTCTIRAAFGQQVGVAASNDCSPAGLLRTLKTAEQIARLQKPNPHFPGFAGPQTYRDVKTYDPATADYSPLQRAQDLKRIFDRGDKDNLRIAGMYSSGGEEFCLANSAGLRAYQPSSFGSLALVALADDFSGFAQGITRTIGDLDTDTIGGIAIDKALAGRHPADLEIGKYDVIFEPAAIAELVEWIGYIGCGSRSLEEASSFMHGHLGEQVMGDNITLYDNAYEGGFTWPLDSEGTPKQEVTFVENGIARGVVYDRISGHKTGHASTGHMAGPTDTGQGSVPMHLHLKSGTETRQQILDKVERGILLTRTHYVNGLLDPPSLAMTGLTRDGAFLIENGKLTRGLKNMRFTDKIVDAFKRVEGISAEREAIPSWWESYGTYLMPTVLIRDFTFTGKSDH